MDRKVIKHFMLGATSACVFAALVLILSAQFGVLPVRADVAPSRLEAHVLGAALHAAVARRAPSVGNPIPASEQNLVSGAKLYREMCSRCHGLSKESDNSYGESFYPPAPLLPRGGTSYSDSEMFWIIKHGIRNTAMPAWGRHLSDDEIWEIVTFVRKFHSLTDSVTEELGRHH